MIVIEVLVALAGAALVTGTLISAVQTVILPRAVATTLTRGHFRSLRRIFDALAHPRRSFAVRDRIMAMYAPIALVTLPGLWAALVVAGFTAIFWGTGVRPLTEAFAEIGSSLFTLGTDRPSGTLRLALSFLEAGIGLGLVSLLISFLPSIYAAFRTREALVGMLAVRAGSPPTAEELLVRYHRIGWLDRLGDDVFERWEQWFIDVEESHTSQGALPFFRSPHPERHWLTAAGCVLDTAAIVASAVDVPPTARPAILIRSGFLCLRSIADFFDIPYDPDPDPTDPIAVTREEFVAVCDRLREFGLPVTTDMDQAWRDFVGWRMNYDEVLLQLCALTMAPPAPWSSDRMPVEHFEPPARRRRRNRRA